MSCSSVALPVTIVLPFLVLAYQDGILGVDFEQDAASGRADGRGRRLALPGLRLSAARRVRARPADLRPGAEHRLCGAARRRRPGLALVARRARPALLRRGFLWAPVFSAVQTGNVTLLLLARNGDLLAVSRDGGGPTPSPAGWRSRRRSSLAAAGLARGHPAAAGRGRRRRCRARRDARPLGDARLLGARRLSVEARQARGARRLGDLHRQGVLIDRGLGVTARAGSVGARRGRGARCVVWFGRRGDDRRSFAVAAFAMLAASPIVWLHSFALLLAPVARAPSAPLARLAAADRIRARPRQRERGRRGRRRQRWASPLLTMGDRTRSGESRAATGPGRSPGVSELEPGRGGRAGRSSRRDS